MHYSTQASRTIRGSNPGPLVQPSGEYAYVHLMLGNHGNNHRDFKLASKITLAPCTLAVMTPSGAAIDLKPQIVDMGHAEKEGFWTAQFQLAKPVFTRCSR